MANENNNAATEQPNNNNNNEQKTRKNRKWLWYTIAAVLGFGAGYGTKTAVDRKKSK